MGTASFHSENFNFDTHSISMANFLTYLPFLSPIPDRTPPKATAVFACLVFTLGWAQSEWQA